MLDRWVETMLQMRQAEPTNMGGQAGTEVLRAHTGVPIHTISGRCRGGLIPVSEVLGRQESDTRGH